MLMIRKLLCMHVVVVDNFSIFLRFSYVGNLDRRCTEQFIKEIFSKCGKVVRCKMINAVRSSLLLCVAFLVACRYARSWID